VNEVGDLPEDFALGAFSGSGSTEKQNGAVFHKRVDYYGSF
jgi:hypothetical protein